MSACEYHEKVITELEWELKELRGQLIAVHRENDRLRGLKESSQLARQLKRDNVQLVDMLSATTEFENFQDDIEDAGGLTFVRPVMSASQRSTGEWVPEEALDLVERYHALHSGLETGAFSDLLLELNAVWRRREQAHIARVRLHYNQKLLVLKRRLNQARPYDDVIVDQRVTYLRDQLNKRSGHDNNGAEHLLEASVSTIKRLSERVAQLEAENASLSRSVHYI